MNKHGWTENEEGQIFIFNQEESIKPKNIVEKIDFESEWFSSAVQSSVLNREQTFWVHSAVCLLTGVSSIMATSQ